MVSWDDVFMAKIEANLPTKASSTGLIEISGGRQACRRSQGAPKRSGIKLTCRKASDELACISNIVGTTGHQPVVW